MCGFAKRGGRYRVCLVISWGNPTDHQAGVLVLSILTPRYVRMGESRESD
jgi:hypothetical protein